MMPSVAARVVAALVIHLIQLSSLLYFSSFLPEMLASVLFVSRYDDLFWRRESSCSSSTVPLP